MEQLQSIIPYLAAFFLIALASSRVGEFFSKIRLPKITGYLFTGVIVGGFVLNFLPQEAVHDLHFIIVRPCHIGQPIRNSWNSYKA